MDHEHTWYTSCPNRNSHTLPSATRMPCPKERMLLQPQLQKGKIQGGEHSREYEWKTKVCWKSQSFWIGWYCSKADWYGSDGRETAVRWRVLLFTKSNKGSVKSKDPANWCLHVLRRASGSGSDKHHPIWKRGTQTLSREERTPAHPYTKAPPHWLSGIRCWTTHR